MRAKHNRNSKPLILWAEDTQDLERQAPILISKIHGKIQIECTSASMLTMTVGDFEILSRDVLALMETEN